MRTWPAERCGAISSDAGVTLSGPYLFVDGTVRAKRVLVRPSVKLVIINGALHAEHVFQGRGTTLIVVGECEVRGLFFAAQPDVTTLLCGRVRNGVMASGFTDCLSPDRQWRAFEGGGRASGPSLLGLASVTFRGASPKAFVEPALLDSGAWARLSPGARRELLAQSPNEGWARVRWNLTALARAFDTKPLRLRRTPRAAPPLR